MALSSARWPLALMVLSGAMLSFGMEPLVGRAVLPSFGGAAHVWNACMMVFQGLLLLGYAYAHLLAPRIGRAHLWVLLLPLLQLPLGFVAEPPARAPMGALLWALVSQVSLPFFVLSTTAVIAQSWHHRATLGRRGEPYRLYGLSNVGSLVALLAYPFVVEPFVGLRVQGWLWTLGYGGYVVVSAWTWRCMRPDRPVVPSDVRVSLPSLRDQGVWLVLSAAPSAILLAVTNAIATEVGSFPLVWVVPLALYLFSFSVAFREPAPWIEALGERWPDLTLAMLCLMALLGYPGTTPAFLVVFFSLVVVGHATLYRVRPHPEHLTRFYLVVALGGFIGGGGVTLLAPVVFRGLTELYVALACLGGGLLAVRGRPSLRWWRRASLLRGGSRMALLVACGVLTAFAAVQQSTDDVVERVRSFYGIYRVEDHQTPNGRLRRLVHGRTVHGMAWLDPARAATPLTYYHSEGAIAEAIGLRPERARVAVIGLGVGTMAAYLRADESMVFYEIDPQVEVLARTWFPFLDGASGEVSVRSGDARMLLWQERVRREPRYDQLYVDAFSGDGVPVHLLTVEALSLYLERVEPDGIVVFHISNRHYDLRGVLKASILDAGLSGAYRITPRRGVSESAVVAFAVARTPAGLAPLEAEGWIPVAEGDDLPDWRPWTDDRLNLLGPLWQGLAW